MDRLRENAIQFAVGTAASVLAVFVTQRWQWGVIVLLLFSSVWFTVRRGYSFRSVGIVKWSPKRGDDKSFRECLQTATASLDFLATWGGSIPSLSPNIEDSFRDLVRAGCKFRFLLLRPGSEGETKRRLTRGDWPAGQLVADIRWLLSVRDSMGLQRASFRVALYSQVPVWAMVIVDNKQAIVGFYGTGTGRNNPALLVEQRKNTRSFFDAFRLEYERLWASAAELETERDFENILDQAGTRRGTGLVIAIHGPSGSGKTMICKQLIDHGVGTGSTTVTTRPRRQGDNDAGQYEYVSPEEFSNLSDQGELLCEAEFSGHKYGVRPRMVFDTIQSGKTLLLDTVINPRLLRARIGPQLVQVFLTNRWVQQLADRMIARGDLTRTEINARLQKAREQSRLAEDCDYIVLNEGEPADCVRVLEGIVQSIVRSHAQGGILAPDELAQHRASQVLQEKGPLIRES